MKTNEFTLPCKLSREEVEARARQMADLDRDVRKLVAERKQIVAEYGARQKALDAELEALGYQVRERQEPRKVQCRCELRHGQIVTIRTDTGDEVQRRPATQEELQGVLPFNVNPIAPVLSEVDKEIERAVLDIDGDYDDDADR